MVGWIFASLSNLLLDAIAREMLALAKPWDRADQDWTAMLLLEDLSRTEPTQVALMHM